MTGVKNRRYFLELADEELRRIDASHDSLIALVDIDNFKKFNDLYGHDVGDEVLIALAQFSDKYFEGKAIFGRMGGEEFAIFMPQFDETTKSFFEEYREGVAGLRIKVGEKELSLTVSVGVAKVNSNDEFNKRFKQADLNLYDAKNSGRNRCIFLLIKLTTTVFFCYYFFGLIV